MTPQQVDMIDRIAVTSSILVVAVVDNPSSGVGIEIEMAYHAYKPVVLLCHKERIQERRISRLVRGNPSVIAEITYASRDDALAQLEQVIRIFLKSQTETILPHVLKVAAM